MQITLRHDRRHHSQFQITDSCPHSFLDNLFVLVLSILSSSFYLGYHSMVLTESFPCMILHRRNLACRGCGCPRSENQVSSTHRQGSSGLPSARFPSSPRFIGSVSPTPSYNPPLIPNTISPSHYPNASPSGRQMSGSQPGLMNVKPPSPSHPLLTPSGRAFAVGGKVQNVSGDPLAPCVMYWPDNEPPPEQGQIRPSHLTGVPVRCCFYSWHRYLPTH